MYMTAERTHTYNTRRRVEAVERFERPVVLPGGRSRVESRRAQSIRRTKHAMYLIMAVIVFLTGLGLIAFKSVIAKTNLEINHLNEQIWELRQENSRLEGAIVSASNIEQIKADATKLGMGQPTPDQVKYLTYSDVTLRVTPTVVN